MVVKKYCLKSKVLVYRDYGVDIASASLLHNFLSYNNSVDVSFVDSNDIINKNILNSEGVSAIVFPQGDVFGYSDKLGLDGGMNLVNFIYNGGNFVTFGMGSHYACDIVHFNSADGQRIFMGDIQLFDGGAYGSLPELTGQLYNGNLSSAGAVKINFGEDLSSSFFSYYHGGPKFVIDEDGENCKVLATYDVLGNGKDVPAIVECTLGSGKAVLLGIDPEFTYRDFQERAVIDYLYRFQDSENYNNIVMLSEKLEESEMNGQLDVFMNFIQPYFLHNTCYV